MPKPETLPTLEVELLGHDGNAFAVLGQCRRVMKRNNYPQDVIDSFMNEAMAGNYDHLLATVMEWFDVT